MTDERLEEIKDSIDFQLTIAKSLSVDDEVVLEEKELYDEIIRLNKEKSILEKALKLIWKKDIKINYEELDKANKIVEKELKGDNK